MLKRKNTKVKHVSITWGYNESGENGKHIPGQSYGYGEGLFTRYEAERDARIKLLEKYPNATTVSVLSVNSEHSFNCFTDDWCAKATGEIYNKRSKEVKIKGEKLKIVTATWGYGLPEKYGKHKPGKEYYNTGCDRFFTKKDAERDAKDHLLEMYPNVKNVTVSSYAVRDDKFIKNVYYRAVAKGEIKGRTVTVKFGQSATYDDIPKERAMKIAADDARERLLKLYPDAENIDIKYDLDDDFRVVRAKAIGYIYNCGKEKKLTIEDIYKSRLYLELSYAIRDNKVKNYIISYEKGDRIDTSVTFKGTGPIDWEAIKNCINRYNTSTFERIENDELVYRTNREIFYIDINSIQKNCSFTEGYWRGTITLSDGNWITIERLWNGVLNCWYNGIVSHNFPKYLERLADKKFSAELTIEGRKTVVKTKS